MTYCNYCKANREPAKFDSSLCSTCGNNFNAVALISNQEKTSITRTLTNQLANTSGSFEVEYKVEQGNKYTGQYQTDSVKVVKR